MASLNTTTASNSGRNQNGALNYSTRSSVRDTLSKKEDEKDALTELLQSRGREGFAASAYWGATGDVPPREPDDETPKDAFRFHEEISRKLVPFPEEKTSFPRTMDYTLIGMHLVGETPNGDNGGMNASQLRQLQGSDGVQLEGDGQGGVKVKPRFLNMTTTTQRMPGEFDDGVMQALRDGKDREDELLRRLQGLRGSPFGSTDPDPYRLTSDDYCDFSQMDPKCYRVTENNPANPGADGEQIEVYRSRYNNVEREGPKRRERTFKQMQRGRHVDRDKLRSTLDEGTKRTMPRGWQGYSAKDWMSTTHREHAAYDTDAAATMNSRDATVPLRNTNYQLNPGHELAVTKHDERFSSRNCVGGGPDGVEYNTEYSDKYVDRFDEADVKKDFTGKSVFDIKYGVYTMDHQFHHPREDANTGETYTPAELVPGQYTTMSTEPLHARNDVGGSYK